jgi:hypothetical protein
VTDATASLQAAGGVGLVGHLPAGVSNAPVRFTFDDYLVILPQ